MTASSSKHGDRTRRASRQCRECGADRDNGSVLMMVVLSLSVLMIATSFSIDLGRQMLRRRDMQAIADVVVIDMARQLHGQTKQQIDTDPAWTQALRESGERNHFTPAYVGAKEGAPGNVQARLMYELGWVKLESTKRTFMPYSSPVDNNQVPTAVRITANDDVDYFFSPGGGSVTRSALASRQFPGSPPPPPGSPPPPPSATEGLASFKLGSFLASVDPNSTSIVGQVLNTLIPGTSIGSYQGLIGAQVTLEALGLNLPVGAVTPDNLANVQVSMYDLMIASIRALQQGGGNTAAISVLQGMISTAPTVRNINLGDALGLDLSGGSPPGSLTLDVIQIVAGAAFLSNGSNAVSIPGIAINGGGIGTVDATLSLIEGERTGAGGQGFTLGTRQVQLTLTPHITLTTDRTINECGVPPGELNLIGVVLNTVLCLVGPVLSPLITLTIDGSPTIAVTAGEVNVQQNFDCPAKALTLTPLNASLLSLDSAIDLEVTATIGGNDLGTLLGVHTDAGVISSGVMPPTTFTAFDAGPKYLAFNPASIQHGSVPVGLAGLLQVNAADVTVLNASLPTVGDLLKNSIAPLVNTMLGELDARLVTPLANMLGLNLAGAKLTPIYLNCDAGITPQG